jgi:hypothetical protein
MNLKNEFKNNWVNPVFNWELATGWRKTSGSFAANIFLNQKPGSKQLFRPDPA